MSQELLAYIRVIEDFPKPGISFKDITTLIGHPEGFRKTLDELEELHRGDPPDAVAGIESRGFIFGAALADRFGCGLALIRKAGKLPAATYSATYELEYGTAAIEVHRDAFEPGQRVLLVDDLLATGGTARAAAGLIEKAGARVLAVDFVIELDFLKGREKLNGYRVNTLIHA
ncbi:MAG: adenine phosphoribosyltransferase [Candidatus Coatesbacteria bacterium RBG_13_66_14]|uniref:Adenine phosphoribosyltransferase n=1 Tax=Candidatus Coatesbacteria bacterium RBG_13_66_14 TaxID=1817816 RepID=A0A1F5EY89_9BACT|nr:MAG: adenine phosphoribosyltransferase [Candidatus Coatesbacteria bacterium RBG_13_66_14]